MTISVFGWIVLLAGVYCQFRPVNLVLSVACLLTLFSASSAFTVWFLGGANIIPAAAFLPFIVLKFFSSRGARSLIPTLVQSNWSTRGMFLFTVYAAASAFVLPWFFAGDTLVHTLDRSAVITTFSSSGEEIRVSAGMQPLKFNAQNITQASYLVGGFALYLIIVAYKVLGEVASACGKALLLAAGLNVFFGALDLVSYYGGFPEILAPFRTGGYVQHSANIVEGFKRVSGTFPEASAFAGFSLSMFAFTWSTWHSGFFPRISLALCLATVALLVLSTSSTAYVAMGVLFAAWALIRVVRFSMNLATPRPLVFAVMFTAVSLTACVYAIEPDYFNNAKALLESAVLNKLDSDSALDRAELNRQALVNVTETYLIGVGVGGTAASSYLVVLLSNVGVPGLLLFVLAIFSLFASDPEAGARDRAEAAVVRASRYAVFAHLTSAMLSATVADLGLLFFYFVALGTSFRVRWAGRARDAVSKPI